MPQYLSMDPDAGQPETAYLSTDPHAGFESLPRKAWRVATTPVSESLTESIVAGMHPPTPLSREQLKSLVGGALSPIGLASEFAGALGVGSRAARMIRGARHPARLEAGAVGKIPRFVSESEVAAQAGRRLRLPSQIAKAPTLEEAAAAAPKAAPKMEAQIGVFRPSTSKGPRATVKGAQGLTVNDIGAVEQAIAERTGVSPRITAIRATPEAQRTIEEGRKLRSAGYRSTAELDKGFRQRLESERGGLSTNLLKSLGRGANQLRVTGMLSGLALPKSVLGNIGAIGHGAVELKSLRPITESFHLPTNFMIAARAFRNPANPAAIQGMGKLNLPGRVMSALDETTQAVLQRGGATPEKAQQLLLTSPNAVGGTFGEALNTGLGRYVIPFQRTPFNQFSEGLLRMSGKRGAIPLGLAGGAMAGGAAAGSVTQDPRLLGLGTALAGPSGLPFALGAAMTAGPRAGLRGALPFNELGLQDLINPIRPLMRPAFIPAFLEP